MKIKNKKLCFIRNLFYSISIKNRLLIYFIALVILPTSIIAITVYIKSTDIIVSKTSSSLQNNMNTIEENILQKLDSINSLLINIYLNQDVLSILSSERPTNKTDIVSEMNTLDKILESYQTRDLEEVTIIPKLYMFNRPEYLMYHFSEIVSDSSVLEKEKWFLNMPAEAKYKVIGPSKLNSSNLSLDTIIIAKRLFALRDINIPYAGILTVDVDINEFANIITRLKPSTNSSIFIIDENNNIIISPEKSELGRSLTGKLYISKINSIKSSGYNSFVEDIDNSSMLVAFKKIENINWTIIALSPMSDINGELNAFNRIVLIVIIICAVLAFGMVLYLADNISYPIRKIVKSMAVVRNGNFDISIEYKRNDEFAYLINTYKKMISDINDLVHKLYVSEKNKREAELKLLQAQINPHFLYNTLDSINWLSLKYKANDISTMVTSLSDFFRYSLSKGNNIISLGDEIKQVESYLIIQKIRFKDKFDYTFDFSADIVEFLTVKLVMQPIVENSILHGIQNKSEKGTISITLENIDGIIEIIVIDDGIGADVDLLNSILEGPVVTSSFAISNVNERIKHFFGEQYGIKFYNNKESGLKVIIRFPAIKTMEGLNVTDDYR